MKIVIESPLAGDFQNNFRYALWCARAVWLKYGRSAIASHLLNPWFMDDTDPRERQAGIDNEWVWSDASAPHWFFTDLGMSRGMGFAEARCLKEGHGMRRGLKLAEIDLNCWEAFERGEWPPHTPGFEVKT